jgi:hypothetical protein
MMKVRATILALLPAAVLATSTGRAQQGPVAAHCKADIPNYCAGREYGGGEVRACLEANKDKLSA